MTLTEAREKFVGVLTLSPREYQVFCYAGKGMSRPKIALRIGVHISTVGTYVERLRAVFGTENYWQLIALAGAYLGSGLEREPLLPEDARYKFVEDEPKLLKVA